MWREPARYSLAHQLDRVATSATSPAGGLPSVGQRRKPPRQHGCSRTATTCTDLQRGPSPVARGGAVKTASISNYPGLAAPLPCLLFDRGRTDCRKSSGAMLGEVASARSLTHAAAAPASLQSAPGLRLGTRANLVLSIMMMIIGSMMTMAWRRGWLRTRRRGSGWPCSRGCSRSRGGG